MDETQSLLPKLQQDMEEVRTIMSENVIKTKERELNLTELDQRAEKLYQSSKCFVRTTRNLLENQRWEKKCRIATCVLFFLIVFIAILTVIIVLTRKH